MAEDSFGFGTDVGFNPSVENAFPGDMGLGDFNLGNYFDPAMGGGLGGLSFWDMGMGLGETGPLSLDPSWLGAPATMAPPSLPQGPQGPGFMRQALDWGKANPMQAVGAGITGLGAVGGLIGLLQAMSAGAPVKKETVTRVMQEASPQERQLLGQALQQLQQLQGLAMNQELQRAVSQLAQGQLPIGPDLISQVTKAFSSASGDIAEQAIQNARERGFAGGTELLGGPGSPYASRALAQLGSDVSRELINLGLGMPQAAAGIQGQLMQSAMQPLQAQTNLLNVLGSQRGMTQTGTMTGPEPTLMSSFSQIAPFLVGMGQLGAGVSSIGARPPASERYFEALLKQQQPLSGVQ